jgi:hypothetical protein
LFGNRDFRTTLLNFETIRTTHPALQARSLIYPAERSLYLLLHLSENITVKIGHFFRFFKREGREKDRGL